MSGEVASYGYAQVSLLESVHEVELLLTSCPWQTAVCSRAMKNNAAVGFWGARLGVSQAAARVCAIGPMVQRNRPGRHHFEGTRPCRHLFSREKKGDSRMIVDSGRVGVKFRTPRSVTLLTGEECPTVELKRNVTESRTSTARQRRRTEMSEDGSTWTTSECFRTE